MRSSVDGLVNPTLFVWSIGMTESTYVDHFRVSRINHDSADLASILQAHVRPRGAAVDWICKLHCRKTSPSEYQTRQFPRRSS